MDTSEGHVVFVNWSGVCLNHYRSSLGESGPKTDRLAMAMGEVVQRVGRFIYLRVFSLTNFN